VGLLKDSDKAIIRKEFEKLSKPIRIVYFTQEHECAYCKETAMIINEVAELSDKISVEVYDLIKDREIAEKYRVDKIPATVIATDNDSRIRFYGIPSGYEFVTFLEDIKMVSSGDSGLEPQTRDFLRKLKKPIHMQIFVTPT